MLTNYVECVEALGGDPLVLMSRVDISPAQLEDPEGLISLESTARLMALSAETLQAPDFGFLLGQRQTPKVLGVIGMLMQQCPDYRTALHELLRHSHLHNQGVEWELREEGDFAFLVRHLHLPGSVPTIQLTDLALFIGLKILRLLCGSSWQPRWVSFRHRVIWNRSQLRQLFNAELRFGQEFDGFVFAARDLDISFTGADENIKRVLDQHIATLEAAHHQDICAQTRLLIKRTMGLRECNIESIARMLSMHKRTLQRQLTDKGITFKELQDEIRFETAQRLLRETHTALTQIAEQLGYAELSVFSRAFKNRFGVPPAQWRKENQADSF